MLPSAQEAARILANKRSRPIPGAPPTVGRALVRTLKALDAKFGYNAEGLKARWSDIVGATTARRTEPVKLVKSRTGEGAVLEIRVDGPSATLVQHQGPDLLARVNLFLGPGAVSRLRIIQGPLQGYKSTSAPAAARALRKAKGPLDAAAEQALADSLAHMPDDALRAALLRLGREVMRR